MNGAQLLTVNQNARRANVPKLFKTAQLILQEMKKNSGSLRLGSFLSGSNYNLSMIFGFTEGNYEICFVRYQEIENGNGSNVKKIGAYLDNPKALIRLADGNNIQSLTSEAKLLETAQIEFGPSGYCAEDIANVGVRGPYAYYQKGFEVLEDGVKVLGFMKYLNQ